MRIAAEKAREEAERKAKQQQLAEERAHLIEEERLQRL